MPNNKQPIYFVMGVSASGKTTLGKALAEKLNLPFLDGDDYHPPENIEKMSAGIALTDTDREFWLTRLQKAAHDNLSTGCIIACSALKESYRNILSKGIENHSRWIVLSGPYDVIQARIEKRTDHFMPPGLLQSQFEALELPNYGTHLEVTLSLARMLYLILNSPAAPN